jgi:murein DD-endopeptidase MepM/ murein hydrolase activator NlpD
MTVLDDIGGWIDKLKGMFGIQGDAPKPPSAPKKSLSPTAVEGGYQSPIRGSWKNSGNFSPGVATDKRHQKGHNGVDMRAPGGTSIYPLTSGVVTNAGTDPMGGNVVNVKHDAGITTYYAHLGSIAVTKGDKVDKDTVLGTVGDSGNAAGTWPHLHFQVWKDGVLVNPGSFFNVPAYSNVDSTEKQWLPGQQEAARNWKSKKASRIDTISKSSDLYFNLINKIK